MTLLKQIETNHRNALKSTVGAFEARTCEYRRLSRGMFAHQRGQALGALFESRPA